MLTERSIINFLIWVGGLILGPYLVAATLWRDYLPIGITLAVLGLFFMFSVVRDRLCIAPIVGFFMSGHITLMPARMAFSDFGIIALITYYVVAHIALRRAKVMTGPLYFFIPILIVTAIVVYHDHDFGLRMTGGGREGGRGVIILVMGTIAYLCGVSVSTPSPRLFYWTPAICMGMGILSAIPFSITTYFPWTAPYIYMITDNVNVGAYTAEVLDTDTIVRNNGTSSIATLLIVTLLCYFPAFSLWRPNRWWIVVIMLVCLPFVISGGYRSGIASFGLTVMVASACYSKWRVVWFLPLIVGFVFFVTFLQNSHLVKLPESAQRSLSFVPGDWDQEVKDSAKSSNDFRDKISKMYLREEVKKSPFLGNGLTYSSADFDTYTMLAKFHESYDGYYGTKEFVTGKMFHIGWISLYDAVGLLGGAAFMFFELSLLFVTGRMIFGRNVDQRSLLFPAKVWILSNSIATLVGFFTTFGDFKTTFPMGCFYAIIWTHLNRLEKYGYLPAQSPREVPFDPERTTLPVPA